MSKIKYTEDDILGFISEAVKQGNYQSYIGYLEFAESYSIPEEKIVEAYLTGSNMSLGLVFFDAQGAVKEDNAWKPPSSYRWLSIPETMYCLNQLSEAAKNSDSSRYRYHLSYAKLHGVTMDQIKYAYNYGRRGLGDAAFLFNGMRRRPVALTSDGRNHYNEQTKHF